MEHDLIKDNPMLKKPVLKVLGQFGGDEPQEGAEAMRSQLERALAGEWDPKCPYSPTTVVDILVRNRCLTEQAFVNGEPYQGKPADLMCDESVPDDAEVWASISLTQKGAQLAEVYRPANTLLALFDERPQYADAYKTVLWACEGESGCNRPDLESQLNGLPALQRDPETGRRTVYPQYFIDALESAGGIVWDGAWRTTAVGREVLERV